MPELLAAFEAWEWQVEVIVVDDGSEDGGIIAAHCKSWNCRYLRNESARGKGNAVRKGILSATAPVVMFMDGDFPFDLETVHRLVSMMQQTNAGIVIGNRTDPQSQYPKDLPLQRQLGSYLLSRFIRMLNLTVFKDTQCGIKCFRTSVGHELFSRAKEDGFAFDIEILALAQQLRIPVVTIPVSVKPQATTTVKVFRHGWQTLRRCLAIWYNQKIQLHETGMGK
ncbi:putative glycosyltransferase [Flavihumibacter petaseus NBRC 106054]|uniref:Putative glycosyltransferase n=2 Tax=Flavihumibacter TaxID=1004301 RepID=A0A0E9MUE3_9BACT|nr:putative glycosyltransferase [Flavihumibacter petaseus NBRC 106054]